MPHRLAFIFIFLFWLVMNGLLIRSEWGGQRSHGNPIPPGQVIDKILTAPDDSSLSIGHRKEKIGYCRWTPSVGDDRAAKLNTEAVEGLVQHPDQYSINLDGNVALEATNRIRFEARLLLDTNQNWEVLTVRLHSRRITWEVEAKAATQWVQVHLDNDGSKWDHRFSFQDFSSPGKLLQSIGLSGALPALPGVPSVLLRGRTNANPFTLSATHDWLRAGHSQVRVYRLEAVLGEHFRLVVYASRVGEILRVDLPGDLFLLNDTLFIW